MRRTIASYLADCKRRLGEDNSDRVMATHWGCSEQLIQKARAGKCSDPLAIKIAELLGEDPGEVLLVARAEREPDQVVKEHLLRYAGKALRAVPSRALSAAAALAVALGVLLQPKPAEAMAERVS